MCERCDQATSIVSRRTFFSGASAAMATLALSTSSLAQTTPPKPDNVLTP